MTQFSLNESRNLKNDQNEIPEHQVEDIISKPNSEVICFTDSFDSDIDLDSPQISQDIDSKIDISQVNTIGMAEVQKLELVNNLWTPGLNFIWPHENRGSQKRYASESDKKNYPWLAMSNLGGYYCKICRIFGFSSLTTSKNGNYMYENQIVNKLVIEPYTAFGKMFGKLGKFERHQKCAIHKKSSEIYSRLLQLQKDPSISIANAKGIESTRSNLLRLKPGLLEIIKTLLFISQRGLPLRGTGDSGVLDPTTLFKSNEGLFRDLMKLKVDSGCNDFKKYLQLCNGKPKHLSPQIQNEILSIIGDLIVKKIRVDVDKCGFYTCLVDETEDISSTEQLAVSVKYISDDFIPRERFLGFFDCYEEASNFESPDTISLNGQTLATVILNCLKKLKLNPQKMAFFSSDGAPVLSGQDNGVIKHLRDRIPHISHIICNSHNVNNAIGKGLKLPLISRSLTLANSIITFFGYAKRSFILKKFLNSIFLTTYLINI